MEKDVITAKTATVKVIPAMDTTKDTATMVKAKDVAGAEDETAPAENAKIKKSRLIEG